MAGSPTSSRNAEATVPAADQAARQAIEAVFRIERPRLVAALTRLLRDLDAAEELAQDAFLAALVDWPRRGVPGRPGAWLMTTARRRAIDRLRRQQRRGAPAGLDEAAWPAPASPFPGIAEIEAQLDDDIGDHRLGLIFAACHPLLRPDARVALTLRLLGGLETAEIARAFLTREATVAQRIVRAKRMLGEARVDFEVPHGEERRRRLVSVLEVLYLIFSEGYAATRGEDLLRPALCQEARRLGRILARLVPDEPEAWGLLALMDLQASRLAARTSPDGRPVPLPRQDRGRWDWLLVRSGLEALEQADRLASDAGIYQLQARIAACHARAVVPASTDWPRIAGHYDRLLAVMPSPVVALNRAIAHGMAFGPELGLQLLDGLARAPALQDHPGLPAARADCLARAGRLAQARAEFERAAGLAGNARQREFLLERAREAAMGDNTQVSATPASP